MDNRAEVREFLTSRRAKITPERAGLAAGARRRFPGLRRSEVADLADLSVEYYAKLERGNLAGASASVLEAIARALQLDDPERAHLLHLAQTNELRGGLRHVGEASHRLRPAGRASPVHAGAAADEDESMGFACGTLKDRDAPTVVWVIGEVDMAVAARLGAEIEANLLPGSTVALDCAGINFMDSLGVQVLARAAQIADQAKAEFILVTVPETVRRVLELSGLSTSFTAFDNLTQAGTEIAKR